MQPEKRRAADTLSFCFATGGRSHLQALGNREKQTPRRGCVWIWPLDSRQLQPLLAFAPAEQALPSTVQRLSQDSGGAGTHSLGGCSLQQGTPSALLPRPSRVRPSRPRERALTAGESCLPQLPGQGSRWRSQTGSSAIGFLAGVAHGIQARDVAALAESRKPRLGPIRTLRPHPPAAESSASCKGALAADSPGKPG